MDWKKITKYLILFFVIINIALWLMYYNKTKNLFTVSDKQYRHIRSVLENNNIILYDFLPDYKPMARLEVKNKEIDEDELRRQIFGKRKVNLSIDKGQITYTIDKEALFIRNDQNGLIRYINGEGKYPPKKLNRQEVIRVGNKFLKEILNESGVKIFDEVKKVNKYNLTYYENYNDKFLFNSFVNMNISEKGIEEVQMIRYQPVKFVGEKRYIYPPNEIILHFIEYIRNEFPNEQIVINSIDIGYYINEKYINENIYAEALPYYKIKLGSGDDYCINAYTNNEIIKINSLYSE